MCDFELIVYRCKHTSHRRFAYCHHARSQPGHVCSGVKALKRVWPVEEDCESCTQQCQLLAQQQQQHMSAYGGYQGYGQR